MPARTDTVQLDRDAAAAFETAKPEKAAQKSR